MSNIAVPVQQQRAENTIGASQAAAALGLDPYTSPLELWQELRSRERRERPAFVQEAADWGSALEPIIRGKYALSTGRAVFVPSVSSVRDGWLRCTPDGFAVELFPEIEHFAISGGTHEMGADETAWIARVWKHAKAAGKLGLLQVKTCSSYKRDDWAAGVPPEYEIQVRVEMAVCDLPWCDVVCLVGGQTLVGPFRVERDLEIEANIIRDLRAFWELVLSGKEPPVDDSVAWREYASARMKPTAVVMKADEQTEATIVNWVTVRKQIEALEKIEALHKTEILLKLSAAGATKVESRLGVTTAYPVGAKPRWKEYAISLGGSETAPDKYRGESKTWALRAPGGSDAE